MEKPSRLSTIPWYLLWRYPSEVLIWAFVYWMAARVSLVGPSFGFLSFAWLPAGVGLALLTVRGPRYWPAVALGTIASSRHLPVPAIYIAGLAFAHVTEALVGRYLLLNLCRCDLSFRTTRDVLRFLVAGAGFTSVTSATIISLLQGIPESPPSVGPSVFWPTLWLGNAMGIVIVAPAVMVWAPWAWRRVLGRVNRETLALTVAFAVFGVLVSRQGGIVVEGHLLHYGVFPIGIWLALRHGSLGAGSINFGLSLVVLVMAPDLIPDNGNPTVADFLWLPAELMVMAITNLSVGAVTEEWRSAETQVRRSEQKFLNVFLNSPEVVTITRLEDGVYLDVNDAFEKMTGYTRAEVVGKSVKGLGLWANEFSRDEFVEKVMKHGQVTDLDVKYRFRSGEIREGLMSAVLIELDGDLCLLSIARDVTEKKRVEDRLRASEEWFRMSFEYAPVGLVLLTVDHSERRYNKAFRDMLGYQADEIEGKTLEDLTHPDDWGRSVEVGGRLERGEADVLTLQKRYLHKMGHSVDARATLTLIRDAAGVPIYRMGQVEDLAARRELVDQLRHGQASDAVGRLAAGVAHDFNNLMMIIKGYTELSLNHLEPDDPLYKNSQEIQQAADRAASLTHQLLAYAGKQVLRPQNVDLAPLLADVARMLRQVIGSKIEIDVLQEQRLWKVRIDPGQLRQALINLALNSEDAMPDGGRLVFSAGNADINGDEALSQPGVEPGRYVELRVEDNGRGMDQETLAHIFEPFFSRKPTAPSAGLGLASVLGIVRQSGGHILADSEPGKGAIFRLYLPAV